jgi:hypothetical protein
VPALHLFAEDLPFAYAASDLRAARTIVDLAGYEEIQSAQLAEALQYRPKLMSCGLRNFRMEANPENGDKNDLLS